MGQQQLLLVILVTIIVGIATVVAINTFSSASDSANVDAARQDVLSLASDAQAYYMQPEMMGGGGQDFSNIVITDLNCPGDVDGEGDAAAGECVTENGTYTLSGAATGEVTITGTPSTAGGTLTGVVVPDDILQSSGGESGIAYVSGS